jgi:hypothetical protein
MKPGMRQSAGIGMPCIWGLFAASGGSIDCFTTTSPIFTSWNFWFFV